ncbi:MAG: hypothetical protein H0X45_06980 [Planctomycetes bacterium]|nr:hypothetical protein [Planctomycetota bacterium]
MRRTTTIIALAAAAFTGCADPSLGGNVANGDRYNHPSHPYDKRVANARNPTGNQSGPWVGETGLNDTWTGIEDRVDTPAGQRTTQKVLTPDSTRAAQDQGIQSTDEETTPVDMLKPDPTDEVR